MAVFVDAEPSEEGLEKAASDVVRGVAVELAGIAQQFEVRECCLGAVMKPVNGAGEFLLDDFFLEGGFFELVTEPRDRVRPVCGQVDKSFF